MLRLKDHGYGIEKEVLEEIFSYGYTTKKDGHGFGLHSSRQYMLEMNGQLLVESEGIGKGATFVLQFS